MAAVFDFPFQTVSALATGFASEKVPFTAAVSGFSFHPRPRTFNYVKRPVLSATIHPDIKKTLVSMSERTGMSVSQVTDEVLYTGLVEMQEL